MKTKDKYQIERKYIKHGNARSGKKLTGGKATFLVAHETANNKADALDHFNYFNNSQPSASAHTFIDDKRILEIIPLDEKAWHVQYKKPIDNQIFGADSNDAAIGTELCRTGSFKAAYDKYVWYHAYLCRKFNLDPTNKIVAHKILDPQRRSDPQSWFTPNGVSWQQFINDVKSYYDKWETDVNGSQHVSGDAYQVQKGDTFWGIAQSLGVDMDDLMALNSDKDPDALQIGSWLKLPSKAAAPSQKPAASKPAEKYPLPTGTFRLKSPQMKGEGVLQIQKALIAMYFYPEKNKADKGADGYFGAKTENALERFQSVYTPYDVDGIYGTKTRAAMDQQLRARGLK